MFLVARTTRMDIALEISLLSLGYYQSKSYRIGELERPRWLKKPLAGEIFDAT